MNAKTNQQIINLQVTDGLTVAILQDSNYDFLMDTNHVALGYGVAPATVRSHKIQNKDEFKENVHFVSRVQNTNARENLKTTRIFWTKQGIIRLGFFIKSPRAKMFRDWAEHVILEVTAPPVNLPEVHKRNHNRLTHARLLDIMVDIAKVDDKNLRISLMHKLGLS